MTQNSFRSPIALLFALTFAAACAHTTPRNASDSATDSASLEDRKTTVAETLDRQSCAEPASRQPSESGFNPVQGGGYSSGDILKVTVIDGDAFSATVEVDPFGMIDLPHLAPLHAANMTRQALQQQIADRLIEGRFFRPGYASVSIELLETGPRRVNVSGAVFQPGTFVLNDRGPDSIRQLESVASGDNAASLTVADALRRAAGIRPDADIANIVLVRQGQRYILDMAGAFTGASMDNPDILSGDRIIVHSRQCFQDDLVRVSAITAPGIRLFMSNLTRPAASNAASAIGRDAINLPYGSRLIQAAVSANCVGGTYMTNAHRYVVLITREWETGRSIVVEQPIEDLIRRADRDDFNPYLQEGDALACYDSRVTNARDVLGIIGESVTPALLVRGLVEN